MNREAMTDEEFIRTYDAFEQEGTDDFIRRHSRTREELTDTIEYLIRHREMLRDVQLKGLTTE